MAGGISSCLRCHCHCRLACDEAVSAAISSPFTSSAPPCMWCMRCMQMVHCSKPLVLRCQREQRRIRTEVADAETRPFSSVSALVAAAFGPAVGSAACRVRSGDTRAACIRTRAAGAASGCAICSSSPWQSTAWQAQQDFAATADWRVRRGRECGNQQPIHVISSSLYVVHARRLARATRPS